MAQFLEIDEALLTGESDPVRRDEGDRAALRQLLRGRRRRLSGRQGGPGLVRPAARPTQARRYHFVASPMTRVINRLVQILSYTAVGLIVVLHGRLCAGRLSQGSPPETRLRAHDRRHHHVAGAARDGADGHDFVHAGRRLHGPARGGRATTQCRRGDGVHQRHLHRQDRHADHQQPASGSAARHRRRTGAGSDPAASAAVRFGQRRPAEQEHPGDSPCCGRPGRDSRGAAGPDSFQVAEPLQCGARSGRRRREDPRSGSV